MAQPDLQRTKPTYHMRFLFGFMEMVLKLQVSLLNICWYIVCVCIRAVEATLNTQPWIQERQKFEIFLLLAAVDTQTSSTWRSRFLPLG